MRTPSPQTPATAATARLRVGGMRCAGCAARVEKSLLKLPGVLGTTVQFATSRARVEFDPARVTPETLAQAVRDAGYYCDVRAGDRVREAVESAPLVLTLALAAPIVLAGHAAHQAPWVWGLAALATAVQFGPGRVFYEGALRSLRSGVADMDLLVCLGISAAYGASCAALFLPAPWLPMFDTSVMLVFFIRLGKYLESRVRLRARDELDRLLRREVGTAHRRRNGAWEEIDVDDVEKGDLVVVRPGERIPTDGVVIEGTAAVDESVATGESVPVVRGPGATVRGGTVATDGAFLVRASAFGEDSYLARIVRMIEEAQDDKPPIQRLADRLAASAVPVITATALAVFFVWWAVLGRIYPPPPGTTSLVLALNLAIAVLVVACPCALGLATPLAVMAGSRLALSRSILFRHTSALELIGQCDTAVIDKTGTLTRGRPWVARIVPAQGVAVGDLLRKARLLVDRSVHPFARAIARECGPASEPSGVVDGFREVAGQGIEAVVGGQAARLGSLDFALGPGPGLAAGQAQAAELEASGATPVALAWGGRLIGLFALADEIRPEAREAVTALGVLGIGVILASGDRPAVVGAVARAVGLSAARSRLAPEDKVALVRELESAGHTVAMVGDGINDAPALSAASVGVVIGSGTDLAKQSGDLVLVKSDLRDLVRAVEIGRATLATIRQNLAWALIYNLVTIPVAAGILYPLLGWTLPPALCGFLMSVSSIGVVLNSMRLAMR